MAFMKTNTVTITVDGVSYDSLQDLGLAIHNTDPIGTPVQGQMNLAYVPGHNGPVDTTEAVFGEQYFQSRPILIEFGGIETPEDWDAFIADIRNKFEGKLVRVEFATLPGWYFKGRCSIEDYSRKQALGTFTFAMNNADPYMYRDISVDLTSTAAGITYTAEVTRKTVVPTITTSAIIVITLNGETYTFDAGTHRDMEFRLQQGDNVLTITGAATVNISYTDGSL